MGLVKMHNSLKTGKPARCNAALRPCIYDENNNSNGSHVILDEQDVKEYVELIEEESHGGSFGKGLSLVKKDRLNTLRDNGVSRYNEEMRIKAANMSLGLTEAEVEKRETEMLARFSKFVEIETVSLKRDSINGREVLTPTFGINSDYLYDSRLFAKMAQDTVLDNVRAVDEPGIYKFRIMDDFESDDEPYHNEYEFSYDSVNKTWSSLRDGKIDNLVETVNDTFALRFF